MASLTEFWSGEEYDSQYAHLYEKNVLFMRRQIISSGTRRLLDVCCGTGLVSIPLSRFVVWVTGIDLSKTMLNYASYKALDVNNIEFLQADAHDYQLDMQYDMAVLSGNAVQSFLTDESLLTVLKNLARHLCPGAKLVFDARLPFRANVIPSYDFDFGGMYSNQSGQKVSYFAKREHYDEARNVMHFRKRRVYSNGDVYESKMEMRYRSKALLLEILDKAGFDVVSLHRNWNGDLLKSASLQMVCVACRR